MCVKCIAYLSYQLLHVLGMDIAISFQDGRTCDEVWQLISTFQEFSPSQEVESDEEYAGSGTAPENDSILPDPSIANLQEICDCLTTFPPASRPAILNSLSPAYIVRLIEIFNQVEDLESEEDCRLFFHIAKRMFLLNDMSLLRLLVSEQFVMDIIGMLEYDPDLPSTSTFHAHRDFLERAQLTMVVPIKDKVRTEQSDSILLTSFAAFRAVWFPHCTLLYFAHFSIRFPHSPLVVFVPRRSPVAFSRIIGSPTSRT